MVHSMISWEMGGSGAGDGDVGGDEGGNEGGGNDEGGAGDGGGGEERGGNGCWPLRSGSATKNRRWDSRILFLVVVELQLGRGGGRGERRCTCMHTYITHAHPK